MSIDFLFTIAQKIAAAILIILAGFIIAKLASKFISRILAEAELNRIMKAAGFQPISDTIGYLIEYLIYAGTILMALQQVGLTNIVLGFLVAVAAIVIIISLTLTLRDFVPNAVTGLFMRSELTKKAGQSVRIGVVDGRLLRVGITSSVIDDNGEHYVPHLYTARNKIKTSPKD